MTTHSQQADAGAPRRQLGQHPPAERLILHISDTHFVGTGELMYGQLDCDAHLVTLFEGIARSGLRPDAIVFTGDLADTGRPDAYARLRAIVEPAAAALGAEVIWVMGNHDERGAFRTVLLGEGPGTAVSAGPITRVVEVNGLRIIALDTSVPGHGHGELGDEQLEWLREQLSTPAPAGTLLVMHHPPVPSPIGLLALVELREQHRLAPVIAGSDVRAILAGHLHYSTHSTFAGVPVSVASATCYTQDLEVEYPSARGQDGAQSYNLVHVYEHSIVHSVVPIGEFPTVYEMSVEMLERALLRSPE